MLEFLYACAVAFALWSNRSDRLASAFIFSFLICVVRLPLDRPAIRQDGTWFMVFATFHYIRSLLENTSETAPAGSSSLFAHPKECLGFAASQG